MFGAPSSTQSPIALFLPTFGDGGVERMLVHLSRGLIDFGRRVDFLVSRAGGPYLSLLPSQVRLVELGTSNPLMMLLPLTRYFGRERPTVCLSAKRYDSEALRARRLAGVDTRIFVRVGTTPSQRDSHRNAFRRWRSHRRMRRLYPRAHGVIAVSQGVAEDVARSARVPLARIHVVPNPVIPPELADLATAPVDHPWFAASGPPVILGAGGLRRSKDFPTLLRAFARLREKRVLRLVILGEGRQRPRLEALAAELGVRDDVSLPGFVANPYAYMARAHLFVLSSLWEGSPNVVVEAMAVGTPVVCTDCPSGPQEILQGGTYGPLVPVGNADAMAGAMAATLDTPPSGQTLKAAAAPYTIRLSTERYLEAFGIMC